MHFYCISKLIFLRDHELLLHMTHWIPCEEYQGFMVKKTLLKKQRASVLNEKFW